MTDVQLSLLVYDHLESIDAKLSKKYAKKQQLDVTLPRELNSTLAAVFEAYKASHTPSAVKPNKKRKSADIDIQQDQQENKGKTEEVVTSTKSADGDTHMADAKKSKKKSKLIEEKSAAASSSQDSTLAVPAESSSSSSSSSALSSSSSSSKAERHGKHKKHKDASDTPATLQVSSLLNGSEDTSEANGNHHESLTSPTTPVAANGTTPTSSHKKSKGKSTATPSTPLEAEATETSKAPDSTSRTPNKPFQRVDPDAVSFLKEDPRLKDNSFQGDEWGSNANRVLSAVKGKGFRHEKTKKKRGSYRGGALDQTVRSVKFD